MKTLSERRASKTNPVERAPSPTRAAGRGVSLAEKYRPQQEI